MHQVEGLVDVVERQGVGDHGIDFDLSLHVPIDDFRHVRTAARAAEGGAAPHSPGDQLKRPCRDFLTSAGNADNNALAPTAVAALQRRAHQIDVADAFERVIGAADLIGAAFGHVDEMRHEITADVFRIDEMRHAKSSAQAFFAGLASTPIIMSAPTRRRPWITLSPMPPRPKTMHFAPGSTLAVLMTAPTPVVTPQPM